MTRKKILIYTDIGDDIDDSLAIVYLLLRADIEVIGIVCDHENLSYSKQSALSLLSLLKSTVPVVAEGGGAPIICKLKDEKVTVLSIGPTRQLCRDIESIPNFLSSIDKIYFQGQILIKNGQILPDQSSYNFKQDVHSAQRVLSHDVPMVFVGKYLAYEFPLKEEDIVALARDEVLGAALCADAKKWRSRLEHLNKSMFEKLYGGMPLVASFPYDLLTAIAILHSDFFEKEDVGDKTLIGQHDARQRIKDKEQIRMHIKG